MTTTHPTRRWTAPSPDGIPLVLRQTPRWVCWGPRESVNQRTGEAEIKDKVPVNGRTGRNASATNPRTWSTFEDAWDAYAAARDAEDVLNRLDGVGFVLGRDEERGVTWSGVDLDDVIMAGVWRDEADAIVTTLNSYAEFSPSGEGVKIFTTGEIDPAYARKTAHDDWEIEAYDSGRYFTMTGNHVTGTPPDVLARTDELHRVQEQYLQRRPEPASAPAPTTEHTLTLADDEILRRARHAANGAKFQELWDGGGPDDRSAGDAALVAMLKFWSRDPDQLDRLFRASGRMRPKWDQPHRGDGATYGQMTIEHGLGLPGEQYGSRTASTGSTLTVSEPPDWLPEPPFESYVEPPEPDPEVLHLDYVPRLITDPDDPDLREMLESIVQASADATVPDPPIDSLVRVESDRGDEAEENANVAAAVAPYEFTPVFPDEHFIGRYIRWAAGVTDAPHVYHEALGAALIAALAPRLRVVLTGHAEGLALNLYIALVGETTRPRKSTCIGQAQGLLRDVDSLAVLPNKLSGGEALIEQLGFRSGVPSVWFLDELSAVLYDTAKKDSPTDALLTLYGSPASYDYARHSKRNRDTGEREIDADRVRDPHFLLIGATTPAVFERLREGDVQSGLLPRFAFVYPQKFPPRMSLSQVPEESSVERARLVAWLTDLQTFITTFTSNGKLAIDFDPKALRTLDRFEQRMEESRTNEYEMTARLPAMSLKLSVIAALGAMTAEDFARHLDDDDGGFMVPPRISVTPEHAAWAVGLAERWAGYAEEFGAGVGMDRQGRLRKRVLDFLRKRGGSASRSQILRGLKCATRDLNDVKDTLEDSSLVVISLGGSGPTGGRPGEMWTLAAPPEN